MVSCKYHRAALSCNSLNTYITVYGFLDVPASFIFWWLTFMFWDVLASSFHCLCKLCIFSFFAPPSHNGSFKYREMKDRQEWKKWKQKMRINYSENFDPIEWECLKTASPLQPSPIVALMIDYALMHKRIPRDSAF